jgi:hypothetical protein
MQSSPLPCYLVPLRPKYSSQHSILVNSAYIPPTVSVAKFHTHIKTTGKIMFVLYLPTVITV